LAGEQQQVLEERDVPGISREQFEQMRSEFGHYGSWAVWAPGRPGAGVRDGIDDLSIFDTDAVLQQLHNEFVIVALNVSEPIQKVLGNFHSDSPYNNDYKMRHAFADTPLWGSWITDILKDVPEVDSRKIAKNLKQHRDEISKHVEVFLRELEILGAQDARIVALGNLAESLTRYALHLAGRPNDVRRIYHYAHYIGQENYRAHVHERLFAAA
jgi:hypothetical protein